MFPTPPGQLNKVRILQKERFAKKSHKIFGVLAIHSMSTGIKSRKAKGGVMHRISAADYDFMLERNWMRR